MSYHPQEHVQQLVKEQQKEIQVGDSLPEVQLVHLTKEGKPETHSPSSIMNAQKVVIFSVPGPFTGTCSKIHVPSFSKLSSEFQKKGVELFCLAVATPDVMQGWFKAEDASSFIQPLADWGGELTFQLGLGFDASKRGLGYIPKRTALIFEKKSGEYVLIHKVVEPDASQCGVTSAENILRFITIHS